MTGRPAPLWSVLQPVLAELVAAPARPERCRVRLPGGEDDAHPPSRPGPFRVRLESDRGEQADVVHALAVAPDGVVVQLVDDERARVVPSERRGSWVGCVLERESGSRAPIARRLQRASGARYRCARSDRAVIIGFRAHGNKAKQADATARRVIPIVRAA